VATPTTAQHQCGAMQQLQQLNGLGWWYGYAAQQHHPLQRVLPTCIPNIQSSKNGMVMGGRVAVKNQTLSRNAACKTVR